METLRILLCSMYFWSFFSPLNNSLLENFPIPSSSCHPTPDQVLMGLSQAVISMYMSDSLVYVHVHENVDYNDFLLILEKNKLNTAI